MSLENPNTQIIIGNVPWHNDYKNIVNFADANTRNSKIKDYLESSDHIELDDYNIVTSNEIKINEFYLNVMKYNYVMFRNNDKDNAWRFGFIRSVRYGSYNTTIIEWELDVWQQFQFSINYKRSMIERSHIPVIEDVVGANLQPEPFTPSLEYQDEIATIGGTSEDWNPIWVLHMASRYKDNVYEYSGYNDNSFGEYGRYITSKTELENIIKKYQKKSVYSALVDASESGVDDYDNIVANLLTGNWDAGYEKLEKMISVFTTGQISALDDHRNELIGVYAIPKWAYDLRDSEYYATNSRLNTAGTTINLKHNTLSNNYTPRNKKMLTSICRGYMLANRTGLKVGLKPELFTANNSVVTLSNVNLGVNGYQYYISNYYDRQASYGDVSYSAERRVGFDANTGLNKVLNTIGAVTSLAKPVAELGTGIATGNVGDLIQGFGNLAGAGRSAIEQIGQQGQSFGTNSDVLKITGGRATLRFFELSPSLNECEAIDDFFDMFGYSINEIGIPNFTNRKHWNYIKVNVLNATIKAPEEHSTAIRRMFESGVTVWHNINNVGNYSLNNREDV